MMSGHAAKQANARYRLAHLQERRDYDRQKAREKISFVREYKASRGCSRCLECDPDCLQLHHLDPNLKNPLIKGWNKSIYNLGWDDMRREVEKCEVLCANCHSKESAKWRRQQDWSKVDRETSVDPQLTIFDGLVLDGD